jgi:hypothetical protein
MKTYLISYDLHNPGRDYQSVHTAIKALASNWCHQLESLWLINSSYTATEIRDSVQRAGDSNDELFVITLGSHWATLNAGNLKNEWIKNNLIPDRDHCYV